MQLINLQLFFRDVLKTIYINFKSTTAKIFSVKRKKNTSISLSSRIDSPFFGHNLKMDIGSYIQDRVVVNTYFGDVSLGKNTGIGIGSILIGPTIIGENCSIAQNCFISGENHKYTDIKTPIKNQGFSIGEIVIEENVWIGAGAIILPNSYIGKGSIIGAGSIVTNKIPAYSVAVGSPAKVIKQWDSNTSTWKKK